MEKTEIVYPKMDPKEKEKWLIALRSGDYKQGREFLHNLATDTYCCLGVLARAVQPHVNIGNWSTFAGAGINIEGVNKFEVWSQLVRMNDTDKKSFNEIADWIEEYL